MRENMLPLRMLGPLMLMLLMSDAVRMCPTEGNPLLVDPPEIIGLYGETVLLNCSSVDEDHDGMQWIIGGVARATEDEESFVSTAVKLDWNVMAECRIKLAAFECSKDLEITIYKNPEILMFPTSYEDTMVEGSLYELQCDINVAPVRNLTVRWYKGNQTIKTETFNDESKKAEDVSSNLTVSITREESGVQFRCEAQLVFGPYRKEPPVISEARSVFVHYAPELKNEIDTNVTVNEGNSVTLNCEAEGNPPPNFSWTKDGLKVPENSSELIITPVNDHSVYNCTATNDLGSTTVQIHVYMIKAAITPIPAAMNTPAALEPRGCPLIVTPAKIVVRFGDPASANCSTSATDVLKMGWEATVRGYAVDNASALPWSVEKLEDWTIKPECFITLEDFQCTKFVDVTLYKTPDTVSVTALNHDGPMMEGTEFQLNCDIVNVAPVQNLTVKWYRGDENVSTRKFSGTSSLPVNQSVIFSDTAKRDYNKALFRCEAELHLGPDGPEDPPTVISSSYIAEVLYKPLIQDCRGNHAHKEYSFTMDMLPCKFDGNPPPSVQWYYDGKPINATKTLTRNQSGHYTAEVVNNVGKSSISVDITIEYGPSFSCNDHFEVKEGEKLQLKCEPAGIPSPSITWFKDGKKITSPQHWEKRDSGEYLLVAKNQHGAENLTLFIDVLYAPVIKQGNNEKKTVTVGENVTFECSAEGKPPPSINWNYASAGNVQVTAGGRQKNISIRGATSTNAGVYNCVATNDVGSVTRSVTLVLKENTSKLPPKSWLLIILIIAMIIIIIIIIISIIFCKSRKKHGQYSFVKAKDTTDIPMTNRV